MYYLIVINGERFTANKSELMLLQRAYEGFTGDSFEQDIRRGYIRVNPTECYFGERFHDINQPTTDKTYNIAYAGSDGVMSTQEAENYALQHFGVHFRVLTLIDGVRDYFFSTDEQ